MLYNGRVDIERGIRRNIDVVLVGGIVVDLQRHVVKVEGPSRHDRETAIEEYQGVLVPLSVRHRGGDGRIDDYRVHRVGRCEELPRDNRGDLGATVVLFDPGPPYRLMSW